MSTSSMRPEHRRNGSKAMVGKVYGHAARRETELTEGRFADRRRQDACKAMMLGISTDFMQRVIPAYLAGSPGARNG